MKALLSIVLALALGCGGDSDPDGGDETGCLEPATLTTLDMHIELMRAVAAMLAGHPGEREATGFFIFPELDVQRVAVYAGPLVETCSTAMSYDEYCEEDDLCSQIECTGEGAGWIMHFRLAQPAGDYTSATVDVSWLDAATGVTFETASSAGAWSVTGDGAMDTTMSMTHESYPSLLAAGTIEVMVSDTSEGVHTGSVTVGGEAIATVDAAGRLVAAGACASP
jgi:hypothetical protein